MSIHARTLSEAIFHLRGMAVSRPSPGKMAPGDWLVEQDPVSALFSVSIHMDSFPLEIHLTRLKESQVKFLKTAYLTNVENLFIHVAAVHQSRRAMEHLQRDIKQEMTQWYGAKRSEIIDGYQHLDERRKALAALPSEKKVIKSMPSYDQWALARHEYTLALTKAFPGYEGCRDWRDYQAKTLAFREKAQKQRTPSLSLAG